MRWARRTSGTRPSGSPDTSPSAHSSARRAVRRRSRRVVGGDEQPAIWWLGTHGGAGESTLEELFSGSRAACHSWPLSPAHLPPAQVVLVARTHAHGLRSAQNAIHEWASGDVDVFLLGLVLLADAPGRLPQALRQLADLIAGGVPAVWWLPWIDAWRVGEVSAADNAPKALRRLLEDLQAITGGPAGAVVQGVTGISRRTARPAYRPDPERRRHR